MGALDQLGDWVERRATGEFIAAEGRAEVHVMLRAGRVAWALVAGERSAFREHLLATGLSEAKFVELLAVSARLRGSPLQALLRSGEVTPQQLEAALRAQVGQALDVMARLPGAQVVFLEREAGWLGAEESLSLELESVLGALPGLSRMESLRRQLPGLSWTEYVEEGARARHCPSLHQSTLGHGASFVVMHDVDEFVLGVSADGGGLWGAHPAQAPLSGLMAGFGAHCTRHPTPPPSVIQQVLAKDEIVAAGFLDAAGHASTAARPDDAVALFAHRARAWLPAFQSPAERRLLAVQDDLGWWFGAGLSERGGYAWLLVGSDMPPALGWSMARGLARRWGVS